MNHKFYEGKMAHPLPQFISRLHLTNRDCDALHEALAVEGVLADGEGFTGTAEEDLFVGNVAG